MSSKTLLKKRHKIFKSLLKIFTIIQNTLKTPLKITLNFGTKLCLSKQNVPHASGTTKVRNKTPWSEVAFFLPVTQVGLSSLKECFDFTSWGCVSWVLRVVLGLSIRETLILGMSSLVWGSRIPTGPLRGDLLKLDGVVVSVLDSYLREA